MIRFALVGSRGFYLWVGFLLLLIFPGVIAYIGQLEHGLIRTNLSDQVSWGAYIANFTFLVGVAAAAVLLVVPAYVYHHKPTKDIVLLGELLAVSAIMMCLMFILADMGRPDRFIHVLPFLGRLNFPRSVLAWDVIVLNGYLILNLHISGYILFMKYLGRTPNKALYLPVVFISIFWAVSIHTVTAFLYSGLGGRPYWNTAILAPRFLISAFAGGPAILTIAFRTIQNVTKLSIDEGVFTLLKKIVAITMPVNLFLLGCELFKEFYTDSTHVASARYLYFGLHGAHMLQPYIWGAITLDILALLIFVTPKLRDNNKIFLLGSGMAVIGIWTEKGMGLIIPGFIPSPLGDIVEYSPSVTEFFVCLGIWATGVLIYTLLAKVAIGIMTGELKASDASASLAYREPLAEIRGS
ncbi:MAG: sulfate reduction electron transfer complex DsrMKJOP subunit DsrP [Bdellovibrionota bacterium]